MRVRCEWGLKVRAGRSGMGGEVVKVRLPR